MRKLCSFDDSEGAPTERGSATGANAVLGLSSRTRHPMMKQRHLMEPEFEVTSG